MQKNYDFEMSLKFCVMEKWKGRNWKEERESKKKQG